MLLAAALLATVQDEIPPAAPVEPIAGPAAFDVSGEVSLLSDYRFRGVSRSDEDPAAQAGIAVYHDSGLYAGARATSLAGIDSFRLRDLGDAEVDLYAGYSRQLGGGFAADAGIMYYAFAGANGPADHVEPYASLSWLIGPVQLAGGAKYAPAQAGTRHEDMLYLYGQMEATIPFRPWSFAAQVGHQDWGAFGSYWTWSLGVRHQLRIANLPVAELGLDYVDTSLAAAPGRDAGLAASLAIRF